MLLENENKQISLFLKTLIKAQTSKEIYHKLPVFLLDLHWQMKLFIQYN